MGGIVLNCCCGYTNMSSFLQDGAIEEDVVLNENSVV